MKSPIPCRILDAPTTQELVTLLLGNEPLFLDDFETGDGDLPDNAAFSIATFLTIENALRPVRFTGFNFWLFAELTEEGAEVIARSGIAEVDLDTVATVSAATIRILVECRTIETLRLGGLQQITPETARILADFQGRSLSLHGLDTLSWEAAEWLARFPNRLSLGITHLPVEVARQLAKQRGDLEFVQLVALFDDEALAISKHRGTSLSFGELFEPHATTLRILGQYRGVLRAPWARRAISNCRKRRR